MNRQAKITKLQKAKARTAPETLADYAVLASVMEATVKDFKKSLKAGVEINDLDVLADRLSVVGELKDSVDELKNAIKLFPALPEEVKIASVNEFLDAISKIQVASPDIILPEQKEVTVPDYTGAVKQMADAVKGLAISTKALEPKPASQRAVDFVPYRRVIKDGNSFKFDDNVQQGGNGGAQTPTRKNSAGDVYVPIANPDGTSVSEGAATIKKALNEKIDVVDASNTYIGQAEPGTATTATTWRIKKIVVAGALTSILWADGVGTFTKKWDDRATYSYS